MVVLYPPDRSQSENINRKQVPVVTEKVYLVHGTKGYFLQWKAAEGHFL